MNLATAMAGEQPIQVPANAYEASTNPVVVIGEQFIAPYPVHLKIQEKMFSIAENESNITDINNNLIFKVKGKLFSIHDRRTLLDSNGNPIVSLKQKIMTMHRRWRVFRGDSNHSNDLLFSVKKSSLVQMKTKTTLDVFLASNTSESNPDFKVKGSWRESGCTIYAGEHIIGQMHRKHNVQSIISDADSYGLIANPNVDYAFIATLIVILDEINADRSGED